ncbi:hypothetical protein AKJ45_00850 [candidate division MSBL1 archaeon SCGC-AAA261F19]|uniref:Uncharacterized protein n=1 Tax=candidate division MSBL1 archaeon SCGC-AAA261F19 TaxID=1698275 RepID=A0A133VB85_9EURY|nr:hypothetical protein AKJ45_00850 [candidate division MSBL1 archaeon SCGC-AAA261F19]
MIEIIDFALLSLAFSAGVVAFVNPCSFALLPAYLSYFLGKGEEDLESTSALRGILRGAKCGILATLGFAAVFGSIGILISFAGSRVRPFLPQILLIVAPILVILGVLWLFDKSDLYLSKLSGRIELSRSSFFLFAAAYALSSLACVFPVFLMIVFTALSTGGFFSGLSVFLVYTLGMGLMIMLVTISVAFSKEFLIRSFRGAMKYVRRIAGFILIVAGIYLVYYWSVTFVP